MRLDVYLHVMDETESFLTAGKLDEILWMLRQIRREERIVAAELDALKVQVAQNTSVEQSALILIQGIQARIDAAIAAGGQPSDFVALSTDLKTSADALAAAVVQNTP